MAPIEIEKDNTPEEIFQTRLAMRKYLRELMTNQKRAIDILMKEAAEALEKDKNTKQSDTK